MPRTAVFDLDGTLAETAPDLIGAANEVLPGLGGVRLDPAADRAVAGRGGRALLTLGLTRAGQPADAKTVEAGVPAFLAAYEARIDAQSHLYDQAEEVLDGLAADGWRLAVCTNKPERLAVILLERLGVSRQFGSIVGADTLPVRKPDPAPVWRAIDQAGGRRERAVMVGDTVTDRSAAANAGVPCILFTHGYAIEPMDELAPEAVVDGFSGLTAHLERLAS